LRVTRDIPIDIMRWTGSHELIEVVTPFSREFVEQLKVVCADVTCRWEGKRRVWLVHPVCLPDVWWLVMETWGEVDMDDETEGMLDEIRDMLGWMVTEGGDGICEL
jgi:hypothetical protein